jgi:hypothetical protein
MTERWPALPDGTPSETLHAVHMWTQIVGKIRLAATPLVNHWWNSTLQVTPRGLTTGLVPDGGSAFQIEFDFVDHGLTVVTSGGGRASMRLGTMSVARFYEEVLRLIARVGVSAPKLHPVPVEVAVAIPFDEDLAERRYDPAQATALAAALLRVDIVFERFRAGFLGKASPVQFFWGSFDLASSRFSGRRGPRYAGGTPPNVHVHVMHEAYSHELSAAGLWLGPAEAPHAEFYSYAMPAPPGIASATIRPDAAGWDEKRGEFILAYDAVRAAEDPDATLLAFLESTYDAAADLAGWDRELLEQRPACDCDPVPAQMR